MLLAINADLIFCWLVLQVCPFLRKKLALRGKLTLLTDVLSETLAATFDDTKKSAAAGILDAKSAVASLNVQIATATVVVKKARAELEDATLAVVNIEAALNLAKVVLAETAFAFANAKAEVRKAKSAVDNVCRMKHCTVCGGITFALVLAPLTPLQRFVRRVQLQMADARGVIFSPQSAPKDWPSCSHNAGKQLAHVHHGLRQNCWVLACQVMHKHRPAPLTLPLQGLLLSLLLTACLCAQFIGSMLDAKDGGDISPQSGRVRSAGSAHKHQRGTECGRRPGGHATPRKQCCEARA